MPSEKYPRLADTKPKSIILDDSVEVNIGPINISYYRDLGYNPQMEDAKYENTF